MLRAEQAALEQHGRAELLRILDREFEYYKNSYDAVGTQAALIAGFIVAVLVTLDTSKTHREESDVTPSDLPTAVVQSYHSFAFCSLMSLIYTVMSVTTVVVWGPNLALRGTSPSSMERAVTGIKKARWGIYISFFLGVMFFLFMAVTVAWVQMDNTIATGCSTLAALTFFMIIDNGFRTKATFKVDEEKIAEQRESALSVGSVGSGAPLHQGRGLSTDGLWTTESSMYRGGSARPGWATAAPPPSSGASSSQRDHPLAAAAQPLLSGDNDQRSSTVSVDHRPAAHQPATVSSWSSARSKEGGAIAYPAQPPAPAASCAAPSNRVSEPEMVDVLATRLAVDGGGWLQKRDKRGFGVGVTGDGWKRRWVAVRGGCLFYAKAQQPPGSRSDQGPGAEEKILALGQVVLSVGSDGRTIRLSDAGGGADGVSDWRCGSAEERAAWVHYLKAGISAARLMA